MAFLRWTPQILAALHDGPVPFSPALAPRLAAFNPGGIDGSVEVAPTTLDTNAGLIDTPEPVGWFEMTAQPLLQFGTVALDPAPACRGVRLQAALTEQIFDIAQRERAPKGPAHGAKNQRGSACRHLKIADRIAFFMISLGYQPRRLKLQHNHQDSYHDGQCLEIILESVFHWCSFPILDVRRF